MVRNVRMVPLNVIPRWNCPVLETVHVNMVNSGIFPRVCVPEEHF